MLQPGGSALDGFPGLPLAALPFPLPLALPAFPLPLALPALLLPLSLAALLLPLPLAALLLPLPLAALLLPLPLVALPLSVPVAVLPGSPLPEWPLPALLLGESVLPIPELPGTVGEVDVEVPVPVVIGGTGGVTDAPLPGFGAFPFSAPE